MNEDVATEARILRAWSQTGVLASRVHVRVAREEYRNVPTWFLIADLPGIGYKETMTARVVHPLAGLDDDDIHAATDALYNELMIAQNRSNAIGVRRGF